jgi:hypothetical protein
MKQNKNNFSTKRTIIYSDIHFQAPLRKDGETIRPDACHEPSALSVAFQIHKNFGADEIVNVGDLYESALCSGWTTKCRCGQVMGEDGQFHFSAWKDTINMGKAYWEYMRLLSPASKLIQIEGNHEFRCEMAIRENTQLEALQDTIRIRNLPFWKEMKIDYHPYNAVGAAAWYDVSKFRVMHGNGDSPQKMRLENFNVIYGHTHQLLVNSWDKTTRNSNLGKETHRAYSIGCLCKLDPEFSVKGGRANGWANGFAYVYTLPNGMSQIEVVEIVNGNTVVNFNGKTYYAKPLRELSISLAELELPVSI